MTTLVIVDTIRDERTGRSVQRVSHGVDLDSGQTVTLPQVSPQEVGATFSPAYGEYVVEDDDSHVAMRP